MSELHKVRCDIEWYVGGGDYVRCIRTDATLIDGTDLSTCPRCRAILFPSEMDADFEIVEEMCTRLDDIRTDEAGERIVPDLPAKRERIFSWDRFRKGMSRT